MALSLDALVEERPLYEIDEQTGLPKTEFDPLSNTDVFVIDEDNYAFYNSALWSSKISSMQIMWV